MRIASDRFTTWALEGPHTCANSTLCNTMTPWPCQQSTLRLFSTPFTAAPALYLCLSLHCSEQSGTLPFACHSILHTFFNLETCRISGWRQRSGQQARALALAARRHRAWQHDACCRRQRLSRSLPPLRNVAACYKSGMLCTSLSVYRSVVPFSH